MSQGDRESLTDPDPNGLLFGPADDLELTDNHPSAFPVAQPAQSETGLENSRRSRARRTRRVVLVLAFMIVAVVVIAGYFIALPIYRYLNPNDYSGPGAGSVIVAVHSNDDAQAIGETLVTDGVVASTRAFVNAASKDPRSLNIQPGTYALRRHMSAQSALNLLLDPASRRTTPVVVTEGATTLDVAARLSAPPCRPGAAESASCGLGLNAAEVSAALKHISALGLPTDYTAGGKPPTSAEGFLYPATYPFDAGTSASDALAQMVSNFTDQARSSGFTARAQGLHITPYQDLIIASIARAEAKFAVDLPKVARVILNRLAAGMPLQSDATSAYGAKLQGVDPAKITFASFPSPYNTYTHSGLPPTPIDNPDAPAMAGASRPANGPWLYFVNRDKAGHLFFTKSAAAFNRAVIKCRRNNWGCG